MPKRAPHLRCPSCRKIVLRTDADYPFCSDRCRLVDLGKWASGHYKVSSPVIDPDTLDDLDARTPEDRDLREDSSDRKRQH